MDGLRWLLLLFGLLVIAGVYFYSRRDRSAPNSDPIPDRLEPTLGGDKRRATEEAAPQEAVADESPAGDESAESLQKIVTLRLVAKDGGSFQGDELILSMRGIGLRHGKFGIFHRYEGTDENNTIFSAASLIEPGSFDLSNIKEQQLPGISWTSLAAR